MPLQFRKLTPEQVKEEFKRSAASDENIAPIVEIFKEEGITVGDGFTLKVDYDQENGETVDGTTVRATKRRYNAAAESLGMHLKWKVSGHTEKALVERDGHQFEDDVFFTDYLVVRVDSSQPKTIQEGEKKRGRPRKEAVAA